MSEIRVTSIVGENGGDRVGLTTGLTVGPLTGTTGIGATITHHGHAQFAGVCTATSFIGDIDFSAQTATSASGASTTNEILVHYEEGTWTPTLENAGSTTYSVQVGKFTRIGNIVFITGVIFINNHDNSATSVTGFLGLPYSNGLGKTQVFHVAGNENWDTNYGDSNLTGWMTNGNPDRIRIYHNSGHNLSSVSVNDIGDNGELYVTGHYFVS